MQMGMIGLGRMGGNMVKRLRDGGHDIIGFDMNPDSGRDVASLEDLVAALAAPRVVWVMVPAGKPTDSTHSPPRRTAGTRRYRSRWRQFQVHRGPRARGHLG